MRTTLLALIVFGSFIAAAAQGQPQWAYQGKNGALVWSKLNPAWQACNKGHEQSPIDLKGARLNTALKPIEFHYAAGPVTITNTGNGIEVQVDPGSYIVADGVRYDLVSYEFHHPSEHTWRGKFSDMEIDLLHRSGDGKEAIVGIRLAEQRGFPNAILATLWDHMPTRAGQTEKVADMVNPGGLLPADRGYWTYKGSELTPPCAEGVHWYIFEQELSISRSQYNAFDALYKVNTRATQDLHGRKIVANE